MNEQALTTSPSNGQKPTATSITPLERAELAEAHANVRAIAAELGATQIEIRRLSEHGEIMKERHAAAAALAKARYDELAEHYELAPGKDAIDLGTGAILRGEPPPSQAS